MKNISEQIAEIISKDEIKNAFSVWSEKAQTIRLLPEQDIAPVYFEAFVHRSFQNEHSQVKSNYERLEFLGDSLLQTWVSTRLFHHFHDAEGGLSVRRSAIVNENNLAQIANVLGFGEYILLGKGELGDKGYLKSTLLSDVFEAYLGASYIQLDDIEAVFLLLDLIAERAKLSGVNIFSESFANDYDEKTRLQNLVMQKFHEPPRYESKELDDPEYKFEVELLINEKVILNKKTNSIKKTQKELAKIALEKELYK